MYVCRTLPERSAHSLGGFICPGKTPLQTPRALANFPECFVEDCHRAQTTDRVSVNLRGSAHAQDFRSAPRDSPSNFHTCIPATRAEHGKIVKPTVSPYAQVWLPMSAASANGSAGKKKSPHGGASSLLTSLDFLLRAALLRAFGGFPGDRAE